jgi:hypothetical protein
MHMLSRRDVLAGLAGLGLGPFGDTKSPQRRGRGGRICFFTDAHVPAPKPGDADPTATTRHWVRFRKALDKANSFRPSLFVFGGDNVMAVDQGNSEEHAQAQFDNWTRTIAEKVRVPHVSVIGNHDIWYPKDVEVPDRKAFAKTAFGMPNRYYAHQALGWNFILGDVFHPGAPTALDAEQFAWLDSELARTNLPTCIVTHAPFFGPSCQLDGDPVGGKKELRALFRKRDNVRLALSGHQHWLDRCELDRVHYLCGGAVSGAWWGGLYAEFPPAFLILDLKADGSFSSQTVYWETQPGEPPVK